MSTAIIVVILLVICFFGIRSYVKKLKNGCCGGGGDEIKKIPPADSDLTHYPCVRKIEIEGMTCNNCAIRIENAFHKQEGFYAKVNRKQNCALVHMKKPVDDRELTQIVVKAGYTVKGIVDG